MIKKQEIWTFGGSKGGVGKSLICSNIAIYLTQKGFTVLLVDADFGAANLHTYLGIGFSKKSLSDFLMTDDEDIQNIILDTNYRKLSLIPGGEDSFRISNLDHRQINKLLTSLKNLSYDYILIDLGAGTSLQTVDILTEGKKLILVSNPEPAAIENTYRLIKYSFFNGFKKIINNNNVRIYLDDMLFKKQTEGFFYSSDLVQKVADIDETTAQDLKKFLHSFNPQLVLNMVQKSSDVRIGFAMMNVCQKFFGINMNYIGFVEHDEKVKDFSQKRKPIITEEPFSKASRGFKRVSEALFSNIAA